MMGGLTGDHTVVNCNNNEKKKKNTKQTSTMCDMRSLPFRPKTLALRPDSFVIDHFLLFSPQPVENTKT